MARKLCPSCGKPYNGRKCGNCLYENFTEEIAHGFHTHEGEPLVIEDTQRRPIPTKDPFDCDRKTRSDRRTSGSRQAKKKTSIGRIFGILVAVMILVNAAFHLIAGFAARGIFSGSHEPVPEIPEDYGTVLFCDDSITISARGRELRAPGDGISLSVRNDTDQDLAAYSESIQVNGYQLPDLGFYCDLPKKSTSIATLYLDSQYLKYTGSDTVENVIFSLTFCDADSYEEVFEIGPLGAEAEELPIAPSSGEISTELLYDEDGLTISYAGYEPDAYDEDLMSSLVFCLENTTNDEISVGTVNCTINGQEDSTSSLYVDIPAHTKAIGQMYMNLEDEKALTEIQELSVTLQAYVPAEDMDGGLRAVDIGSLEIPIHEH